MHRPQQLAGHRPAAQDARRSAQHAGCSGRAESTRALDGEREGLPFGRCEDQHGPSAVRSSWPGAPPARRQLVLVRGRFSHGPMTLSPDGLITSPAGGTVMCTGWLNQLMVQTVVTAWPETVSTTWYFLIRGPGPTQMVK